MEFKLLKKCLHESLLHFLLIGALLFVAYGIKNDGVSDKSKQIVISAADINRLMMLWEKQRQRPASQKELKSLIEQQIRERVFYREALVMGLDKNDSVVRRRLAQKIEFISGDIAALVEPTDAELEKYLTNHADKFNIASRIDFKQIYFNADRRGATAQADAIEVLNELNSVKINSAKINSIKTNLQNLGDSFMMGDAFKGIDELEVTRFFGKEFAKEITNLSANKWHGPVYSVYGYHLVYINKRIEKKSAELKHVRTKVRTEWMNQRRIEVDKAFYQALREQYDIVIENPQLKYLSASSK